MSQETANVNAGFDDVREALARVPAEVWRGPNAQAILLRAGTAALSRIKTAFVVKARGGTDEAGDRWAPLLPATIAYSRRGRSKSERNRNTRPSQALGTTQSNRWWNLYRQGFAIYKGDKGKAARRAWGILKSEGVQTLFDKYGNRSVEILRDTGRLFNSIQVLRTDPGSVTIGSNVEYAAAHHNGVPGKLPARRLWPEPERWPHSWWADIAEQVAQGVAEIAIQQARNA